MALIRSDIRDALWRGREVVGAGCIALGGVWLIWLGGFILIPLGVLLLALAGALALNAWRRMRFAQPVHAPGVVEVVEGQISYFGPVSGGSVPLPDLVELRLMTAQGQRFWRLKTTDNQALLIPVEALGADRLFDSFAALPGMRTTALVAALEAPQAPAPTGRNITALPHAQVIWRHPSRTALT